MIVVLCFNNSDRNIRLKVENKISTLSFAPGGFVAFYKNSTVSKKDLFPDLLLNIPSGLYQRRQDELRAYISFRQIFFITHLFSNPDYFSFIRIVVLPGFQALSSQGISWRLWILLCTPYL